MTSTASPFRDIDMTMLPNGVRVIAETMPYRDTGCLSIYAGTSTESARKVVESIMNEFRQLK